MKLYVFSTHLRLLIFVGLDKLSFRVSERSCSGVPFSLDEVDRGECCDEFN